MHGHAHLTSTDNARSHVRMFPLMDTLDAACETKRCGGRSRTSVLMKLEADALDLKVKPEKQRLNMKNLFWSFLLPSTCQIPGSPHTALPLCSETLTHLLPIALLGCILRYVHQ